MITLYTLFKETNVNRTSLKHIIKYLGIKHSEIKSSNGVIRKIYTEEDANNVKRFLIEHPYPKTFFSEQTNLQKYGTKNVLSIKENREKGLKFAWSDEAKSKREATNLKKYGSALIGSSIVLTKKALETRKEKFGSHWTEEMTVKCKKTKLDNHGDENYNNYDKIVNTCEEKYKVSSPLELDITKDNYTKSVKSGTRRIKFLKSYNATCNKKYNGKSPNSIPEIRNKQRHRYLYDNVKFDSSYELIYYVYLKAHGINFEYHPNICFEYISIGKKHTYFPDFIVNNEIIEIKGEHYFKNGDFSDPYNRMNNDKQIIAKDKMACMLSNNVKIFTKKDLTEAFAYAKKINFNYKLFSTKRL